MKKESRDTGHLAEACFGISFGVSKTHGVDFMAYRKECVAEGLQDEDLALDAMSRLGNPAFLSRESN